MNKAVVLLSGGLDSAVCLAQAVGQFGAENVHALNILYGQKHSREIRSARAVAKYYDLGERYVEYDLSPLFEKSKCPLLVHGEGEIPEGHYTKGLASTYVPFRNGLFLAVAATYAMSIGGATIMYGAHADDVAGAAYPDCSLAFAYNMDRAIGEGTAYMVQLRAPFVGLTKEAVVRKGVELKAPMHLTWSCYNGGDRPCGVCATCLDRANAFAKAGYIDYALTEGVKV